LALTKCRDCLGCVRLEQENFEGDSKCGNYRNSTPLWVRETWNAAYKDNARTKVTHYIYKASEPNGAGWWRSSIHMPREAARIFLRVKDVRVERLWDITEQDAINEGILSNKVREMLLDIPRNTEKWCSYSAKAAQDKGQERPRTATNIGAFAYLWDKLNAKRGYGWDTNPFVWVISFERISKEEAERLEGLK
jgi:hypothetical protein